MQEMTFWIMPLVLLPGAALLLMSTFIRYGKLHNEFHRTELLSRAASDRLMKRAVWFRNAPVSFYTSVGLFSMAGFIGGLSSLRDRFPQIIVQVLTCGGVLGLIYGAVQLIRESFYSLDLIREHTTHYDTPL